MVGNYIGVIPNFEVLLDRLVWVFPHHVLVVTLKSISLEVYPTSTGVAEGSVVLDDGWSTSSNESRYAFRFNSDGIL